MNLWTPIAACSVFALALAAGCTVHEQVVAGPSGGGSDPGCHGQTHMANTLRGLREARGWLDKAEHNKGGWRVSAIQATDSAIQETVTGCDYAADAR